MGLFKNIFSQKADSSFYEKYNELKILAPQIMKYNYSTPSELFRSSDILILTEQFLEIADGLDEKTANTEMRREALAENPKDRRYPYHSVFNSVAFEKDGWQRVVREVRNIHDRTILYSTKIRAFNEKYSNIPQAEIHLSDESVRRNNMIELPEIKYASVGKAFNKDKLNKFIVIDTETTGLKASTERIVQLSAIKYADWEPVEVWNTYINPKRKMPSEAKSINGITDEMLVDKPTIKQVNKSFREFVDNFDIVGYNLPFDFKFLFAEGIDLSEKKRKYYDVLTLARKAYKKELESFTLFDVAKYNNIYFEEHNSLSDCYATGEVFECVIDDIVNSI